MPQVQSRTSRPVSLPLECYLREIAGTPLLGAEEEQELGWRIDEGDAQARDHLVRANLRWVVKIARGYTGRGLALEDLVAEGNLGLLRAVESFDPSLGIRFSTYACYWIKQSIRKALVKMGKTVRLPAYMADLVTKWKRAATRLQEALGRAPAQEEVASQLGLSAKKLKIVQKALCIHNGASQEETDGERPSFGDFAGRGATPDALLSGADDLRQVLALLEQMDTREAAVLRLRFGLSGEGPRTLKEIGDRLGLTRERVRQIENDGLRKLREQLEAA